MFKLAIGFLGVFCLVAGGFHDYGRDEPGFSADLRSDDYGQEYGNWENFPNKKKLFLFRWRKRTGRLLL